MNKLFNNSVLVFLLLIQSPLVFSEEEDDDLNGEPAAPKFEVKQFRVEGDNPLSEEKTVAALTLYLGQHEGLDGLLAAGDELESALKKEGFTFHRVSLPPQTLQGGRIILKVVEFVVGDIKLENNKFFDRVNVLNSLPQLIPGEPPNTLQLSRSLQLANSHASKKIRLLFSDSEKINSIDARIIVTDSSPHTTYLSFNNTGNAATGSTRLTGGYTFSNLFNKDASASITYTISPEKIDKVNQFGLAYSQPLYSQAASINFNYSSSDVDSGRVNNAFDIKGKGNVYGLQYKKYLLKTNSYKHEWYGGVSFKDFVNIVDFNGNNLGGEVLSFPLELGYSGHYTTAKWTYNFDVKLLNNIESGTNNNTATYTKARTGAKPQWNSIQYNSQWFYSLATGKSFRINLKGQYTSQTLIPGEQFSAGGMDSLRGYNAGEASGDAGNLLNFEYWFANIESYKVQPLLFVDTVTVTNVSPSTSEKGFLALSSIGGGLRWNYSENLSGQLDYGIAQLDAATTKKGGSNAHFSVFYRF